jgi:hypothetical protein
MLAHLRGRRADPNFSDNRMLKNKHQAVSEADHGLEARRLECLEAKK